MGSRALVPPQMRQDPGPANKERSGSADTQNNRCRFKTTEKIDWTQHYDPFMLPIIQHASVARSKGFQP